MLAEMRAGIAVPHVIALEGAQIPGADPYEPLLDQTPADEPPRPDLDGEAPYCILYRYSARQNPANAFLVAQDRARFGVSPDLLIAAMEGINFDGPMGTVYFRPEDHVAIQDLYILKLLNVTDPTANFYE